MVYDLFVSLSYTEYIISFDSVWKGISCTTNLISYMNSLFKSNDCNVNLLYCFKQDGVHFVLCPKQGNKIEGVALNRVCILVFFFVLNMVRVPNPQQGYWHLAHLYPNIGQYSPPPPSLVMSIRHSQALLWQRVDSSPSSSFYHMFFVGFSEILRRWKTAGKLLTLLAFARVLLYRIQGHLFTSHWITIVPIVLYLVLQRILTHVKQVVRSGPAFCNCGIRKQ